MYLRKLSTKLSYVHHMGEKPLRHRTLGLLLEEASAKFNHIPAVISKHQNLSVTFPEVLEKSNVLAASFQKLKLEKGDRVGLWAPNLMEWYVTTMACARAGLILVGLNPAYQPPEIEYCINKVQMKAMVCADKFKSQDYYKHLLEIEPKIKESEAGKLRSEKIPSLQTIISLSKTGKKGVFIYDNFLDLATADGIQAVQDLQSKISPDDPVNIQFTSGTTGKPKAAVVSHYNIVNNGYMSGKRNELDVKHHKICVQVPFFHAYGMTIAISAALNHGASLVLPSDGFNPDKSIDAILQESCTMIYGTPTMYVDLIQRQEGRQEKLTSPEIAVSGGALCSPELFKKMLRHLNVKKVKSVYGLTELTAVAFQSLVTESEKKATTTVGHVGEHIEAKVVDSNNNVVPFGTPGELYIKGYSVMHGYWGDDEKTNETIGRDMWLKTGDQFILEEDGYGRVVGRLKEMIIRGGENIFPKEIEEHLNTHQDILESQVIGTKHDRLGEEVCACVRLKTGKTLTLDDVKTYCKGQLAHFKIPSKLVILEDFPKTTSGKIQKFKLLETVK